MILRNKRMCMISKAYKVVNNGFAVLRDAARGEYHRESDALKQMKQDVFSVRDGAFASDKQNLAKDKANIEQDIARAFHKIAMNHEKTGTRRRTRFNMLHRS